MTTPTPSGTHSSKHTLTAPQSTATPPTHPQLGQFTSPAPRSVPSPAAHRTGQQAGKSPFAASHAASVGSSALNHPTSGSGRGGGGAAVTGLLGSSPVALGMDSPAGLGLGGLGGADMGISVSQMGSLGLSLPSGGVSQRGGSSGGAARMMDDEERRKRLEAVIGLVGQRPGRVSDEGIERLAKRYGVDVQCEPPLGQTRPDGTRQITLAGTTFLIDLASRHDVVQSINWDGQDHAFSDTAAALLKENLTPSQGASRINYTLDKFAKNLERLARLDKLEGPNFNCYEAIGGVYASLKKLYDHEKKAALALFGEADTDSVEKDASKTESKAEKEVLCRKSGRPMLNARGKIGLAVEYWMDHRHTSDAAASYYTADAMDIDGKPDELDKMPINNIYSLVIDCDTSAMPYNPIRVSSSWLSDDVEKVEDVPDDLFGTQRTVLDWQEPPDSYLHNPNEPVSESSTAQVEKLPDIKFVARLDPPLPIPAEVALLIKQLMLQVKIDPNPQEHEGWKHYSYDGLVLRSGKLDETAEWKDINNGSVDFLRQTRGTHEVLVYETDGSETERAHNTTLWSKPERGKLLEEVSFSHPKQIVELLPTLRQYAFLNNLLRRSFASTSSVAARPAAGTNGDLVPGRAALPVDVRLKTTLEAATNPRLELTFPVSSPDSGPKPSTAAHTMPTKQMGKLGPKDTTNGRAKGKPNSPPTAAVDTLTLDDLLSDPPPDQDKVKGPDMLHLTLTVEPNGSVKIDAGEQNVTLLANASEKASPTPAKEAKAGDADDAMDGLTKEVAEHDKREARMQKLGRALEVCEDLGVWIEWVGKQARKEREDETAS